jgi:hypothetical protein
MAGADAAAARRARADDASEVAPDGPRMLYYEREL